MLTSVHYANTIVYGKSKEDIDKNEVSDNGISEDEDLMMREVIQGDADFC